MSTTNNRLLFGLHPHFDPKPGTPFNDAVLKVGGMSVIEFCSVSHWSELFPVPDFVSRIPVSGLARYGGYSVNEQRLLWERDASEFFYKCKDRVAWQMQRAAYLFRGNLEYRKERGGAIDADAEDLANKWRDKECLSLAEFCRQSISRPLILPFFTEFVEKWEHDRGLTGVFNQVPALSRTTDEPEKGHKKPSKKPPARPFANFIDKLKNGFTEEKLNGLLVHMLIKDNKGTTLNFKKYIMHPVIDALIEEGYFEKGNRKDDLNALINFLGVDEGQVKAGYGKEEPAAKIKATAYLKKVSKKNTSNPIP